MGQQLHTMHLIWHLALACWDSRVIIYRYAWALSLARDVSCEELLVQYGPSPERQIAPFPPDFTYARYVIAMDITSPACCKSSMSTGDLLTFCFTAPRFLHGNRSLTK